NYVHSTFFGTIHSSINYSFLVICRPGNEKFHAKSDTTNHGEMPYIDSPFKKPEIWQNACDMDMGTQGNGGGNAVYPDN
ncbi:MAG: hypothetical protein GY850_36195, partial [bacterium]|nr:hypothetical protein [bacterium]